MIAKTFSDLIKQKAHDLGFDLCGIAPSRPLTERENILRDWCASGMNGNMGFLERNVEKRIDPDFLVAGAKSIVVTGLNYYSEVKQEEKDVPVISRYAYGTNYHDVITTKLEILLDFIRESHPEIRGSSFVDSEPLLEKAWAVEAGLGWQGRHSIVINNKIGSFFFIGIIILNYVLEYDQPVKDNLCGSCRQCIELCPTGAINEDGTIDARKCIANLTIENRGPIPDDILPKTGKRIYGCDKCQEVCPWNKFAVPNKTPEFALQEEIKLMTRQEWLNLTNDQFTRLFKGSPIERCTYERFKRNIEVVTKY